MPRVCTRALLISLILTGCTESGQRAESAQSPVLDACPRPALPAATALVAESRCGTLQVAEDPADPAGSQIDLNIMVIPAINPKPKPDPIFFLAGGPGQAATEIGPLLFRYLADLRTDREVVLVDQRGTGSSSPLDCEVEMPELLDEELTPQYLANLERAMIEECLDALASEESAPDPRHYVTPVAMDDLDAVRRALGFDAINLIGASYGTRAALVYLRRHGDHVRSVVLDGVAPLTMRVPFTIAKDAASALETLLADCAREPGCSAAFPELRSHLTELVARLRAEPVTAAIADPFTGEPITTPHVATSLLNLVRAALYSPDLSALLPLAIEQAYADDYQILAALASFFSPDASGMSVGMFLSVMCSEDLGTPVPYIYDPDASPAPFDDTMAELLSEDCTIWPHEGLPADYFSPVVSDVPVLLLSGALDPVTPPHWGEVAAATLSRSRHLIVPGAAHGTMTIRCVSRTLAEFIDTPQPEEVQDRCVERSARLPFFHNRSGPFGVPDDD